MAYKLDKWSKHKILSKAPELAAFLPNTRVLSSKAFSSFIDQYNVVIVKPVGAQGGIGVTQVTAKGSSQYEVHSGKTKKVITGRQATYKFLSSRPKRAMKIVQQKISLAKVDGKPFDVRVMVQRTNKSKWTVTGKLAKIAGAGFIITNTARSKGKVVPLAAAIKASSLPRTSVKELERHIDKIALRTVKRLHSAYRWIRIVGVDMGVDSQGKVWIIEANFEPSKTLFLKLKDKSQYRKIMSFYKKHK